MFHIDFYTSVILKRKPVVLKSQWIEWKQIRECKKPSLDRAIEICERIGARDILEFR
jgi:hypothetical protein